MAGSYFLGPSSDAVAELFAFARAGNRNTDRVGFAFVAIRRAVTSAHGIPVIGATLRYASANTHEIAAAFPNVQFEKLPCICTRDARDAAAHAFALTQAVNRHGRRIRDQR